MGKTEYLVKGFRDGFDIGYRGVENRRDFSDNLPLSNELGTEVDLWNKVMKEVEVGRYAGPYELAELPFFHNLMQSPIGLVPKAGGKVRLIFHLSYDFKSGLGSLNANTPRELCSVKYRDLDNAVKNCLKLLDKNPKGILLYGKTDIQSAFRLVSLKPGQRMWLVMKAKDPKMGKTLFFIDKCLPFGASISCTIFQAFSDALHHTIQFHLQVQDAITNYLDDYLFIALTKLYCDYMIQKFLELCEQINCPISREKTEWGSVVIVFLGMLLDGERHCLIIPEEKRLKALHMLRGILRKKKVTIKEVQQVTGLLNFLNRAVVPGRAFMCRMYAKLKLTDKTGRHLKQYHHVYLDKEFRADGEIWEQFLKQAWNPTQLCRPFVDLDKFETSQELEFYTDALGKIGMGAFFKGKWMYYLWSPRFLQKFKPSIAYLELHALVSVIITWQDSLRDTRIVIFCDNQSVVNMINNTTSNCPHCMTLIRLLVLNGLLCNRRVFVKYILTSKNILADSLSRNRLDIFWKHAPSNTSWTPHEISKTMLPIEKYW